MHARMRPLRMHACGHCACMHACRRVGAHVAAVNAQRKRPLARVGEHHLQAAVEVRAPEQALELVQRRSVPSLHTAACMSRNPRCPCYRRIKSS